MIRRWRSWPTSQVSPSIAPQLPSKSPLLRSLLSSLVLLAPTLAGQPSQDLEERLETARGEERVALTIEFLATPYDNPPRAVALGEEALAWLSEHPDAHQELVLTCGLCKAHVLAEAPEVAHSLSTSCLDRATALKSLEWEAWGQLWCLGKSLARQGQLGLAVVHGIQAVELYEELGDPKKLATALTQAGIELDDLGDFATALEYQLRARAIFQSMGDIYGEAQTLLRAGSVHAALGEHERALEYSSQSYEAFRTADSDNGASAALHNMAVNYSAAGELERALELFTESLEIKKRLRQPRAVALRVLNIGMVLSDLGRHEEALVHLREAIEQLRELDAHLELALAEVELARVLRRHGDPEQALRIVQQAIDRAEGLGIEERAVEGYLVLAELEEQRGAPQAALDALRRYDEIKSRFLNTINNQKISEMEVRYQAESQSREIERLKQEQILQALEVKSQRTTRTALVVGFGLLLLVLALLFNRYRLRAQALRMAEMVENEKAVSASLREVDRLKDDFLANTSHELRTPLYGMVGLAESLLDGAAGALPTAARRNLELILQSGHRLSALVGDILDSAKLHRKGLELSTEPVDLHALADIVVTLSQPLVDGQDIELINAVPRDLPPILADADRLQQVLHNLLGNAVKFTEQGKVTVEASQVDGGLRIQVRDTGIGIAPAVQNRIFQAFEQAESSTERNFGGTGLGLTISRQLVHLHGADLQVESSPGQGARFFFTLPLADGPAVQPSTTTTTVDVLPSADRQEEDLEFPGVETENPLALVLVIDDEGVNRQVLRNHLVPHGYRVLSAASGEEALEYLEAHPIDLALVDIMMPRMSGYEVCRRIREGKNREELPVIFLSAKNRAADRVASFEVGANDYLAKPIAKQELLKRVETHLELLQTHRAQAQEIKVLHGLLTICAQCKKIRDQEGHWDAIENYIDHHSEASFSHGLCPHCAHDLYPDLASA